MNESLIKILKPRWIDGRKVTKFYFETIKKQVRKLEYLSDDDLRRKLIFSGAARFTSENKRELWGLVKENLESLGIIDSDLQQEIILDSKYYKNEKQKLLAKVLLLHPEYNQRKFSTLKEKFGGLRSNEIRRILVVVGGLRFFSYGGKEYWGMALRNLDLLGFAYENPPRRILKGISEKPNEMPYHLASLLLEHPMYYRRSFEAIKNKLGGFKDSELWDILLEVDAIPFDDKFGNQYWGLRRKNKKLLQKLGLFN